MTKAYLFPRQPMPFTSTSRAHSFAPQQLDHAEVVQLLQVESNPRYRPANGVTYCNVAAHDFATLCGVYLPRVWWTPEAVRTNETRVVYGQTVRELNANALFFWCQTPGRLFGWRDATLEDAQAHVNKGGFAVIVAVRKDRSRSGHISVIVPGKVVNGMPLQWQAGATNWNARHSRWYHSPIYERWGVFICDRED